MLQLREPRKDENDQTEIPLTITANYGYEIEDSTSVTVEGREGGSSGGGGNTGGGSGPSGAPPTPN